MIPLSNYSNQLSSYLPRELCRLVGMFSNHDCAMLPKDDYYEMHPRYAGYFFVGPTTIRWSCIPVKNYKCESTTPCCARLKHVSTCYNMDYSLQNSNGFKMASVTILDRNGGPLIRRLRPNSRKFVTKGPHIEACVNRKRDMVRVIQDIIGAPTQSPLFDF
jgi:hypothetical protein